MVPRGSATGAGAPIAANSRAAPGGGRAPERPEGHLVKSPDGGHVYHADAASPGTPSRSSRVGTISVQAGDHRFASSRRWEAHERDRQSDKSGVVKQILVEERPTGRVRPAPRRHRLTGPPMALRIDGLAGGPYKTPAGAGMFTAEVLIANRTARSRCASSAPAASSASTRWWSIPEADTEAKYVQARRRVGLHRAAARGGELPQHPGDHQRGGGDRRRGDPPRLRLSRRRTPTSPKRSSARASCSSARAPRTIRLMGDKVSAKQAMTKAGVPMRAGLRRRAARRPEGDRASIARKIGYPVIIKAAGGGGGRGMRVVHTEAAARCNAVSHDAHRGAGGVRQSGTSTWRSTSSNPRHIEIQVLADEHKNAVYLVERDCSMQRRHQKIIEEAPAPEICRAAARPGSASAAPTPAGRSAIAAPAPSSSCTRTASSSSSR